jgi:hypothetical protein
MAAARLGSEPDRHAWFSALRPLHRGPGFRPSSCFRTSSPSAAWPRRAASGELRAA